MRSKLIVTRLIHFILAITQKHLVNKLIENIFNILKPLPGFLVINTKEKLPALWCLWCFLYTISFRSHLIPPSVWLRARRKTHKCYSFGYLFYRWSLLDTCGNCQKRDWSGCLMDYFPAELIALGVRHSTVAPSHLSGSWNEPFFLVYRAWGSALLATATKHGYGNFQQKAHSSHGEGGSGS